MVAGGVFGGKNAWTLMSERNLCYHRVVKGQREGGEGEEGGGEGWEGGGGGRREEGGGDRVRQCVWGGGVEVFLS